MASNTDRAGFGIQALKVFCLLAFMLTLGGLIVPVRPTHFVPAVPYDRLHRTISLLDGVMMGALSYGIQRRLAIAWITGWVLLVAFSVQSVFDVLPSILRQTPEPGGWVASALVTVAFAAVAAYWGRWWKRQKYYFSRPLF